MTGFGDFSPLCHQVPSYTWCNLFYRQLQHNNSTVLVGVSANPATAPVGVNPVCGIPIVGTDGSLANIGNIIACALSIILVAALVYFAYRRKAAVGRTELLIFLSLYLFTLPLQLITTGAFLHQGSSALVVLTAIHAGAVAATFWALLGNAIVSTQVVEDGTLSSLIPFGFFALAFFAATTYISLDVAFTFSSVFGPSVPSDSLHSIPLFVLTSIWPGAAALIYFALMLYVVLGVLNEVRPAWFFVLSAFLFILSQLAYFLLSKVICENVSQKLDGSFIATTLETAAVAVIFLGWRGITEDSWTSEIYYPR